MSCVLTRLVFSSFIDAIDVQFGDRQVDLVCVRVRNTLVAGIVGHGVLFFGRKEHPLFIHELTLVMKRKMMTIKVTLAKIARHTYIFFLHTCYT